ncbi:hypothetical protein HU200_057678 [Digitaria exilis]|uniref:NAD-dependent epimerase/dehydratase domain-containing protein n=1 Tax=Digitaria exilis TaxID=1010633 RepID=A0A835AGA6_9POAL|nr:hypothetical protein HU200_057678 [Digitaria exilis]
MPGERGVKTACVTGGNGYIASALVKMLLEKGYAVKTTVRNPGRFALHIASLELLLLFPDIFLRDRHLNVFTNCIKNLSVRNTCTDDAQKNSHLMQLQELGPLEILRADLDEEGSFDEAVAGCDYAFLVAAPVNLTSENPEKDQIEPSVRGTLNVLRSCAKAGTVRRVVLTSAASSVCIRPLEGDGHVLDEESWSDLEYVTAEKPPSWGYVVSKVLSEKEALRFAAEHGMSLVIVCPVLTVGSSPVPEVYTSVPASLSMLSGDEAALGMLKGIEKSFGGVPMVALDDLCRAEVFLVETEAASGRFICSSLDTTVAEMSRFLADKYPQYNNVNTGRHSGELLERPRVRLSSAKLVKEGFEFRYSTLDEMYQDVVEYGKALGILSY